MDSRPAMLISADDQSAISGFESAELLDLLTDLTGDEQVKLTQLVSMGYHVHRRGCLQRKQRTNKLRIRILQY